jgi:myo-inositol-1-phosphate synthase
MVTCPLLCDRVTPLQPGSKQDHLERIRADIRDFKTARGLDKVVVLWTANTERFTDVTPGDGTRLFSTWQLNSV